VVLDIAFASKTGGSSFEKITRPFIDGLAQRLAAWVDHHDHEQHQNYAADPRFVLASKAQHGACPEMISPELVERAGRVDTICCHLDFDGLCSAAKWIRGGHEPYKGADDDARAIDTCLGQPSIRAQTIDHALRAYPRDEPLRGIIVRFLAEGCHDRGLWEVIGAKAHAFTQLKNEAEKWARQYHLLGNVALVFPDTSVKYDKTLLLLLGQEKAQVAVVVDGSSFTAAARFDSGVDLVKLLKLDGGMPTRISLGVQILPDLLRALAVPEGDLQTFFSVHNV